MSEDLAGPVHPTAPPASDPLAGFQPGPASDPVPWAAPQPWLDGGPTPRAPAEPSAEPRRASIAFLVTVTLLSLAADLATKAWAKATLSGLERGHPARRIAVLKHNVELIFAQNPGGAWSFLRGLPDSLRRPFFLIVSAAAIVFIVSIYRRIHHKQTAMRWGLPLALGGAMGNLADRVRFGWVVDFIDVSYKGHHWPTFNVADIAIVIGVGLMAVDMARARGIHRVPEHTPRSAEA